MNFETVHEFWFGDLVDGQADAAHQTMWYRGSEEDDAVIRGRFTPFLTSAAKGELDYWLSSARGRLALIILLDQFPRNIFRGTANAFLYDEKVLSIAKDGVALGQDKYLEIVERQFFYMPYQHSEDAATQEQSVELYQQLVTDSQTDTEKQIAEGSLNYAIKHKQVIDRFGRYPHRNESLLRESTAAELGYLASGASRFGQ